MGITLQNATSATQKYTTTSTILSGTDLVSTMLFSHSSFFLCFLAIFAPSSQNRLLPAAFRESALEPTSRIVETTDWNRPDAADRE